MADNNGLDKDTLEKVNKLLGKTEDNLNDFEKALKDGADATDRAKKRLEALGNYVKDLGATSISTEQGMAKYGKSITAVTDTVGDAAKEFGILGKVVGFLIKQIGGLASQSLKQQDALLRSYRTLSDFGAIDSSGLKGVLDNMLAMGANTEQMENFHKVLKQMSPDLVAFGGTVASGAKQFSQVSETLLTRGVEDKLKRLGYTTEEIVKFGGQYVAMQARSGLLGTKNTEAVAAKSAEYMQTLSELTMLTGASRDQAQEAFEQQQRDLAFRLKLQEIERTEGPERAQRMQEIVSGIMLTNRDLGQSIMEQIANDGGMVTEKTARLMSQYPELYEKVMKLQKGSGDTAEGTIKMLQTEVPNIQRIIDQFGSTGKISADAASQLGLSVETLNMLEKLRNTDTKKFREEIDKLTKSGDKRTEAAIEQERRDRNSRKGFENFLVTIGDEAVPIALSLSKAMNRLGAVIADVVYWVTSHIKGMDTVDFRGAFKEFEDLAEVGKTLAAEQKRQKELQQKINDNDEKIVALRQKEAEALAKTKQWSDKERPFHQKEIMAAENEARMARSEREELEGGQGKLRSELKSSKMMSGQARAQSVGLNNGVPIKMGEGSLEGLPIKYGDVHREGEKIDPKLIALANKIRDEVPDFAYFSSFNDIHHKDKENSKHNKGLALDFVLANSIEGNEKAGKEISSMLKGFGASYVLDEYNHPSNKSTGGHIHAEVQGKTQGLFKGPESGYWLKAHGEEALMNQQGLSNLITKAQVAGLGGASGTAMDDLAAGIFELGEKLDEMIMELKNSHSTQQQILTYSKV